MTNLFLSACSASIVFFVFANYSNAVPAYSGVQSFKQSDGKVIQGRLMGDEYLSWLETMDGDVFLFNKESGLYEYAIAEKMNAHFVLRPSGVAVGSSAAPPILSEPSATKKFMLNAIWKEARRMKESRPTDASKIDSTDCSIRQIYFDDHLKRYLVEGTVENIPQNMVRIEVSINKTGWRQALIIERDFQLMLPEQEMKKGKYTLLARIIQTADGVIDCKPYIYSVP